MNALPPVGLANQGHLSEVEIFQDLASEEIEALGRRAPMRTVPAGTIFYTPADAGEMLFILKIGRVRLYRLSPDGKAFTIAIVESGAIFGEMAILGQGMHESHAEALAPCVLCLMRRADVQTLLLSDQRIALRIAETLGRRLLEAEQRLADFALKALPQRLATLLATLAERQPPRLFRPHQRELRLTHETRRSRRLCWPFENPFESSGILPWRVAAIHSESAAVTGVALSSPVLDKEPPDADSPVPPLCPTWAWA